jgi:FlaA1/EpsC-like NDP-sugar epimerase
VWFVPVAVLMVIKFSTQKLYPGTGLGVVEEFRRLTISISLIFIVLSTLSLMLKEGQYISRFVYVLFWMTSMVTIPAVRLVVRHVMSRLEMWGEPVVIIGAREPDENFVIIFMDPKIGLRR